ncbi:hypothetical protein B0H16DRAFT_1714038 [Mycena metata]|uniref:Uncharacterized protein n=1 Tax=Mycena metata TaxID=1033252 RepID=A0AAD7JW05_9AGAR|nr:hypothetical protein B0H16DRAFT_1714038 [Mycena metata]
MTEDNSSTTSASGILPKTQRRSPRIPSISGSLLQLPSGPLATDDRSRTCCPCLKTHLHASKSSQPTRLFRGLWTCGLWKRLGVAEADMDAFVETHRGSTEETVGEYEGELKRMLELMRERMGTFVGSAREEIDKGELMVGEEERMGWIPYFNDEHTEELLTIHEDEIRRLKEEKWMKTPLLASIKRYFDIYSSAAGSVTLDVCFLEQDLLASIPAWEHEAGRPFPVHGQSILHILMQTVSAANQENAWPNVHNNSGKRKPSPSGGPGGRATSVPPRTLPVRATASSPLSRAGKQQQQLPTPPNKHARTETTPSYGHGFSKPAVLGAHRGGNGVGDHGRSSPSKIPLSCTIPTGLPMPARGAPPPFGIFHLRAAGGGQDTCARLSPNDEVLEVDIVVGVLRPRNGHVLEHPEHAMTPWGTVQRAIDVLPDLPPPYEEEIEVLTGYPSRRDRERRAMNEARRAPYRHAYDARLGRSAEATVVHNAQHVSYTIYPAHILASLPRYEDLEGIQESGANGALEPGAAVAAADATQQNHTHAPEAAQGRNGTNLTNVEMSHGEADAESVAAADATQQDHTHALEAAQGRHGTNLSTNIEVTHGEDVAEPIYKTS